MSTNKVVKTSGQKRVLNFQYVMYLEQIWHFLMTIKCREQMPGRALSTGIKVTQTSSSVSLNWVYEQVRQHQRHKCFLLDEHRRVVLHIWKCWSLVSQKTVLCDWRFHVTLFRLWLCSFDSGCQIPLAGFASCHLLHQVSMTFLFKGNHPSLIAAHHWALVASTLSPSIGISKLFHFLPSIWFHSFNNTDTFLWIVC